MTKLITTAILVTPAWFAIYKIIETAQAAGL